MTIKNSRKNISAEPGDIVINLEGSTLSKNNNNSNYSNDLVLTIIKQDFIDEDNVSHEDTITIPMSEVVRLAYLKNNYYTKNTSHTKFDVTVEKQQEAEDGFFATYIIKQNNAQVGEKINIPKDFLVKSASLETVTTNNNPVQGYKKGDKYLDFIINSKDNSETNSHIYINVKELIDIYTADESTLTLSANKQFSVKDNGITYDKLAVALQTIINNKVDKETGKGLSEANFTNTEKNKLAGIQEKANKTIVDSTLSSTSTNPVENKAVYNALNNKVDVESGKGLSQNNFTNELLNKLNNIESEANKIIVDSALSSTSTNPVENKAIYNKLSKKVDKINGKGLSTNDFDDDEKNKLDGYAAQIAAVDSKCDSIAAGNIDLFVPSKTSDLTNDGSDSNDVRVYVETSTQPGLIKNDGTIQSDYLTSSDIIDNLNSSSTNQALSAKMGLSLSNSIQSLSSTVAGKPNIGTGANDAAAGNHNHDSLYVKIAQSTANQNLVTNENGNVVLEAKPNVPTAGTSIPDADTVTGKIGSGNQYALANHQHPRSSIYWASSPQSYYSQGIINFDDMTTPGTFKIFGRNINNTSNAPDSQGGLLFVHENSNGLIQVLFNYYKTNSCVYYRTYYSANNNTYWTRWETISVNGHTHAASTITGLATVATTNSYNSLDNKPTIPTQTSQLTNNSGFLTSHQSISVDGKNNAGTALADIKVDNTVKGTIKHPKLFNNNINSGLYKITVNTDGHITGTAGVSASDLPTISYNNLSDKLTIVDNLDSTSSTSVLSAKQGNALNSSIASNIRRIDSLEDSRYLTDDFYVRLIRLKSNGTEVYQQDTYDSYEGSQLVVQPNDRLSVRVMSRSGQSVANVPVRFGLVGTTNMRFGTTDSNGFIFEKNTGGTPDTIKLSDGNEYLAFAIVKGNISVNNRTKSIDFAYITYEN